MSTASCYLSPY